MELPKPVAPVAVEAVERRAARRQPPRRAGHRLPAQGRPGAGRHRPQRLGQVLAGRAPWSASGRPSAARSASTAPRIDQWTAETLGPAHRLPAAGHGAVRRHRRREHRALRARTPRPRHHRRRPGCRRPRPDPGPAGGLRNADRRDRRAPCRPASASASAWRARSTAIRSWWCWTSRTPISTARASEALTQAILGVRARGGIVSSSPIARRRWPASTWSWSCWRPPAGLRSEGYGAPAAASPATGSAAGRGRGRGLRARRPHGHAPDGAGRRAPAGERAVTIDRSLKLHLAVGAAAVAVLLAVTFGGGHPHRDLRRRHRARQAGRRLQRQEGSAPDRRRGRRAAREGRRQGQEGRRRGAARRHAGPQPTSPS